MAICPDWHSPAPASPSMTGTTGTTFGAGRLEPERDGADGITWTTSTPNGHAHLGRRDRWNSRAPGRAVLQVEHGHHVAGVEPAQRARRAAHADVHLRRRTRRRPRGPPGMFCSSSGTRRLRSTIGSPATVSHSSTAMPTDSTFRPRWPERMVDHQSYTDRGCAPVAARDAWRRSARAGARAAASAVRPRSICPASASEMLPVSSDTTIATASFSSVRPMAARCRVPRSLLTNGLTVSGRKQAAAATRSSWTMTAPSCSGEPGLEDGDEQVVGQRRVERNARLDVVPQPDFALDHDDGADPLRRQHRRGHRQLLDHLVGAVGPREGPEERRAAEVRERAADVGLEQDDEREDDVADHVADEPVDRLSCAQLET